MAYPREEQETVCTYDSIDQKWIVYSTVRKHITRLLKIGGEPLWKEEEVGSTGETRIVAAKWELGDKQVKFAKLREPKQKDDQKEDEDEED